MFCGLGFFATWVYFLANYKEQSMSGIKNILLIAGILFVLAIIEIIFEVKKGFKLIFKLIVWPIKKTYRFSKLKRIERKIDLGKSLTNKELAYWQKFKGEKK